MSSSGIEWKFPLDKALGWITSMDNKKGISAFPSILAWSWLAVPFFIGKFGASYIEFLFYSIFIESLSIPLLR